MSLTVEITGLAYGGNGIGRINNKVVFVPFTAPGDVAEVTITEDKKDFSIAKLVSLKEPSKIRTSPPCPVYAVCGGCHLQHIEYTHQVSLKEKIFVETFQRLAKIDLSPILSHALLSPKPFNYRSRVRFHRSGLKWGFFKPNSHSIVEIKDCPLLEQPLNSTLQALKATDFPDTLYGAEVSLDKQSGKTVAAFYVNKNTSFDWTAAINKIPLIKGFEVWLKDPFKRGKGRMAITEGDTDVSYVVGGFIISSGITSFSQANLFQNERLAEAVVEFSGLTKNDDAFDLFCGAGNFTLPLSKKARKVYASDIDAAAIEDARRNALKNNVSNVEFSIEQPEGHKNVNLEKGAPSVVILDPPRGGAFEVVKKLLGLKIAGLMPAGGSAPIKSFCVGSATPRLRLRGLRLTDPTYIEKIVYVSCAPPTMARDCAFLVKYGYAPYNALVVDMFPQTHHVEGVIAFKRDR